MPTFKVRATTTPNIRITTKKLMNLIEEEVEAEMRRLGQKAKEQAIADYQRLYAEDPEQGLASFRQPKLWYIVAAMPTEPVKRGNTMYLELFNIPMLDNAGIYRKDITITAKLGDKERKMKIKGRNIRDVDYSYWRVLEYGTHSSGRGYYPFFVNTVGGQGAVFMRKRTTGKGTANAIAKGHLGPTQLRSDFGSGKEYIRAWPPPPGARVITNIRNRLQYELVESVATITKRAVV